MIRVNEYGSDANQPPLLIAHGLFGSSRNWNSTAKRLSEVRRVLTVDMRNHGLSDWKASHSYHDLATDLAEVIDAFGGCADALGHSMGGKASMAAALQYPQLIRKLIVADIAPVAYDHSQAHLIEAMRSVNLDIVRRRPDADAMLRRSVEDSGVRAVLLQSLDLNEKRWRLNLDVLEAEMDRITGWPELNRKAYHPTLFIAGGYSDYVNQEGRNRARMHFPVSCFSVLPGAGHWLHAEKPREFEAAVRMFLSG